MASIIEAGGPARRKVRGAVVLAVEVMARAGAPRFASRNVIATGLAGGGRGADCRLSACPLVRLSACPLVRLSACPLVRLSACPPVRLSACPPVRLSACPPVRLSPVARRPSPVARRPSPVARRNSQIAGCRELTTRRAAGGCTRNRCKTRKALIGITHPPTPPHRHAHRRLQPKPAILGTTTSRVLARLRITHDDFSIYQGYLRYAEIVAPHASNAQDAGIFTI